MRSRGSAFHVRGTGIWKICEVRWHVQRTAGRAVLWAEEGGGKMVGKEIRRQWAQYISASFQVGESHHFFSGKGFSVCFEQDQVRVSILTFTLNVPALHISNFWLLESSIWVSILFICWALLGSPTGQIIFIPCYTALGKQPKQTDLCIVPVPGNRGINVCFEAK